MSSLLRSQSEISGAKLGRSLRGNAMFAGALFMMLLMAEAPLRIAMISTAVVSIQTWTGVFIYEKCRSREDTPLIESVVLGFVIGTATSMFSYLLVGAIISRPAGWTIGWLLPTLIALALSISHRKRRDGKIHLPRLLEPRDFIVVVTVGFLYIAQDFRWAMPVFISGACIYAAINTKTNPTARSRSIRAGLISVAAIAFTFGVVNRSPLWWFNADDFQVFEALSYSITHFGPSDKMGALGTIGMQYHFMTYAYSGLLTQLSGAPTFLILNQVVPVITGLMMSAIVWSFVTRYGGTSRAVNFFLLCLFPVFFEYAFSSPSFTFGLVFYLSAIYFWTDQILKSNLRVEIPVSAMLAVFIATSKTSNVPSVLAGLAILTLGGFYFKQAWKWRVAANLTAVTTALGIYFVLFLANNRTTEQLNSFYPFGVAHRIAGDIITVQERPYRILVSLLYTSVYLMIPIFSLFFFAVRERKNISPVVLFAIPAVPLVTIFALFGGHATAEYFVFASLDILYIVLLAGVSKFVIDNNHGRTLFLKLRIPLMLSVCLGAISHYFLDKSTGGFRNDILLRSILSAHWIIAIIVAVLWIVAKRVVSAEKGPPIGFSIIAIGLALTATFAVLDVGQLSKGTDLEAGQEWVAYGQLDQIDAGEWLSKNTPTESIVASNHFCGATCFGPSWFNDDLALLDNNFNAPPSKTGYGTFNFLLQDYAKRRFLIQGSGFLLVNGMPRDDLRARMNASLNFANSPESASLTTLKSFGVDYFVVDKQATAVTDWSTIGTTKYENATFLILELL